MNVEQMNEYIGIPWKKDGNGPDAYNCWTFLAHMQRVHFGVEMPLVTPGDAAGSAAVHEARLRSGEWVIVKQPKHGDGCLLKGGMSPHVGLYLDIENGGVLHCMEGAGVVFTPFNDLSRSGYARAIFYRLKND